ncbi:MAG: PEGA domain-containing protein [Planctomycetota bacterium]|jgi:hypothetical protein
MKNMHKLSVPFAALCLAVVLAGGCRDARTWPADGAVEASASERVVLVAPVAIGPVAEFNPAAEGDFARDIAVDLELFYDNIQAWVGETLPRSDSERWQGGIVGSAAGAHAILLTEVKTVELQKIGATEYQIATVRLRAVNARGDEIYVNELTGKSINKTLAKTKQVPAANPVSKAAWEATRSLLLAFGRWIEDQPLNADIWTDKKVDEAVLVDFTIESNPAGADIYVDGVFRGTTPTVVPLPVRQLTLRLQRQGYQVWETTFVPESGMSLNPGLEPLAGTTP